MNKIMYGMRYAGAFLLIGVVCAMAVAQDFSAGKQDSEEIILGGGCFWCIEAVYERIDGVISAVSGYAGGNIVNPTYKQVVSGNTGHIEVVRISFDPDLISLEEILDWFWRAHDPTSVDRQGADIGPQYRSAVFYTSPEQRNRVIASQENAQAELSRPIVTVIKELEEFYVAEDYHQDYYENNKFAGYCQLVIRPKLKKLSLEG